MYNDDDEWEVDRCAYTVPGMLLWLRNAARDFDYTLSDSWYDPPSAGPKHALLVVDSHYRPMAWEQLHVPSTGANLRMSSRCQPGNAPFTLQPTTPFTIRLGYDPNDPTGAWVDTPLETKTFGPLPAVSQFHDSLGYYPGFWYRNLSTACSGGNLRPARWCRPRATTRPGSPTRMRDPLHGPVRGRYRCHDPRLRQPRRQQRPVRPAHRRGGQSQRWKLGPDQGLELNE